MWRNTEVLITSPLTKALPNCFLIGRREGSCQSCMLIDLSTLGTPSPDQDGIVVPTTVPSQAWIDAGKNSHTTEWTSNQEYTVSTSKTLTQLLKGVQLRLILFRRRKWTSNHLSSLLCKETLFPNNIRTLHLCNWRMYYIRVTSHFT